MMEGYSKPFNESVPLFFLFLINAFRCNIFAMHFSAFRILGYKNMNAGRKNISDIFERCFIKPVRA